MNTVSMMGESVVDHYRLDKARVRASFNRAANTYDAAAVLQKQVREEMLSRLDLIKIAPQAILDAGCGTGHGSFGLQKRFKSAQIFSLDIAPGMLQQTRLQRPLWQTIWWKNSRVCADIGNVPISSKRIEYD